MNRYLTPEHLHAMLNHMPLVGLGCASLVLLYALIRRLPDVLAVGFLMCCLFGGTMVLVMTTGESSEERVASFSPPLDAAGKAWLDCHEERAEVAAVLAYITAGFGVAGLALMRWRPALAAHTGWLTLAVLAAALGLMAWTADAGGQIRHSEFRSASPTPIRHSDD